MNELLVCVFVVMLLSTFFAPMVVEMRTLYRQSTCTDNLMALARANMLYAADAGHYVPYAPTNRLRWHGELATDITKRPDLVKSPLRPYLKGGKTFFRACPLFEEVADASLPAPEKGGMGYGYNQNIGSLRAVQADYDAWEPNCRSSGILTSEVPNPRGTIMFAETATKADPQGVLDINGRLVESAACTSYDTYNRGRPMWGTPTPTIHFRHLGKAFVACCDGHVSAETPGGTKGDWWKSTIGFVGKRTRPAFVPATPQQEE